MLSVCLYTTAEHVATGADWTAFNLAQKHLRTDMLRLYGNKRQLIPFIVGFYFRGDARDIVFILTLQVRGHRAHKHTNADGKPLHI